LQPSVNFTESVESNLEKVRSGQQEIRDEVYDFINYTFQRYEVRRDYVDAFSSFLAGNSFDKSRPLFNRIMPKPTNPYSTDVVGVGLALIQSFQKKHKPEDDLYARLTKNPVDEDVPLGEGIEFGESIFQAANEMFETE